MKKVTSLLLVVTLCLSAFPTSVFSEDETPTSDNQTETAINKVEADASLTNNAPEDIQLGEPVVSEPAQTSENSPENLPVEELFDLEVIYAYYLSLSVEESELFLASLSEDNRFMLLDYIDAMNEIARMESEAAAELAQVQLEAEVVAELEDTEAELTEDESKYIESVETVINTGTDATLQQGNHPEFSEEVALNEDGICSVITNYDDLDITTADNKCVCDTFNSIEIIASGECGAEGDNVQWALDINGLLTLSGSGAMADYDTVSPFDNYMSSIFDLKIDEGVTSLGYYCFYKIYNLSTIEFSSTLTSIGESAFEETSLQSILLPNNLQFIGDRAFQNCFILSSVSLPEGTKSIGERAFAECRSLTEINIPESLTYLGEGAFENCIWIETIRLPCGVTEISDSVFSGCVYLKTFECSSYIT